MCLVFVNWRGRSFGATRAMEGRPRSPRDVEAREVGLVTIGYYRLLSVTIGYLWVTKGYCRLPSGCRDLTAWLPEWSPRRRGPLLARIFRIGETMKNPFGIGN